MSETSLKKTNKQKNTKKHKKSEYSEKQASQTLEL